MPRKTKQNNITTPELLEQVNPENKKLKADFLDYLRSVGRAESTIEGYDNDIDIFFVWNLQNNNNKFFVDLKKRELIAYQNWLLNTNENGAARIRRLKSSLSSMSGYIENILDDEFDNFRPLIRKIESPPNVAAREKTILTDEQLEMLLSELVSRKQYQKACIVALAAFSGSRKSELIRFKVHYFDAENIIHSSLYRTPEKIRTKGRGKQGKLLTKYTIVKKFQPYFDLWMDERKRLGIDSEWLFVVVNNGRVEQLKAATLNSWAITNSKILGVDFYFHSLRHFFTTSLSKMGLPDSVIQQVNGWSSADLVRVYDDSNAEDKLGDFFGEEGVKQVERKTLKDL